MEMTFANRLRYRNKSDSLFWITVTNSLQFLWLLYWIYVFTIPFVPKPNYSNTEFSAFSFFVLFGIGFISLHNLLLNRILKDDSFIEWEETVASKSSNISEWELLEQGKIPGSQKKSKSAYKLIVEQFRKGNYAIFYSKNGVLLSIGSFFYFFAMIMVLGNNFELMILGFTLSFLVQAMRSWIIIRDQVKIAPKSVLPLVKYTYMKLSLVFILALAEISILYLSVFYDFSLSNYWIVVMMLISFWIISRYIDLSEDYSVEIAEIELIENISVGMPMSSFMNNLPKQLVEFKQSMDKVTLNNMVISILFYTLGIIILNNIPDSELEFPLIIAISLFYILHSFLSAVSFKNLVGTKFHLKGLLGDYNAAMLNFSNLSKKYLDVLGE